MATYFVGRQPILDRQLHTVGYELLFRADGAAGTAQVIDGDVATSQVLSNAVAEFGLDNLVGERRAFCNLTEHFIRHPELLEFLPTDRVVLEVLETIPLSKPVINGVCALVERGYTVALDDFIYQEKAKPLLAVVQLIKYDYTQTNGEALVERIAIDHDAGRQVLVERIEEQDERDTLMALGVDLFQGYFFAKPTTLSATGIPVNKLALMEILAQVNDPSAGIDDIVAALSRDVGLSVKCLRFVNSAATGLRAKVDSIQRAAVMLGRNTLRSWINVFLLSGLDDKPQELVNLALYRAKFCELVADEIGLPNASSAFTVGMLSLLDVMMDTPLDEMLAKLDLADEVSAAILGDGSKLSHLLDTARALEHRDAPPLDLTVAEREAHLEAMRWAGHSLSSVPD